MTSVMLLIILLSIFALRLISLFQLFLKVPSAADLNPVDTEALMRKTSADALPLIENVSVNYPHSK